MQPRLASSLRRSLERNGVLSEPHDSRGGAPYQCCLTLSSMQYTTKFTLPSTLVKSLMHLPPNIVKSLFCIKKHIAAPLLQVKCITLPTTEQNHFYASVWGMKAQLWLQLSHQNSHRVLHSRACSQTHTLCLHRERNGNLECEWLPLCV